MWRCFHHPQSHGLFKTTFEAFKRIWEQTHSKGTAYNGTFLRYGKLEILHHGPRKQVPSNGKPRILKMTTAQLTIKQKNKSQLTRMDEKGETDVSMADVRFEDTQEIQVVQDKCQQLAHVFDVNRTVLRDMETRIATIPPTNGTQSVDESDFVQSLISESNIQMNRINSMLKRLAGTIALVRDGVQSDLYYLPLTEIVDQNNTRFPVPGQSSTQQPHDDRDGALDNTGEQDDSATHEESFKRHRHFEDNHPPDPGIFTSVICFCKSSASVLRYEGNLRLLLVPQSMMGMQYISVESAKKLSIEIAGEFWVFVVLTAVLLLCTLSPYFLYIRRHRADDRHDESNAL
jgi:hypothetical protein